jgi:hypothetical protein
MDKEIEKLKKIYLETSTPSELKTNGFEDILMRRQHNRKMPSFSLLRFAVLAIMFLVIMGGFASLTFSAQPHTALYSVKVATQEAVSNALRLVPPKIETNLQKDINIKKDTPAVISPTKSPVKSNTDNKNTTQENKASDSGSEEKDMNNNSNNEEVKGVSTTTASPGNNENNHLQSQTHGNSQNQSANKNNENSSHNKKK